jgi:hypothetical protein
VDDRRHRLALSARRSTATSGRGSAIAAPLDELARARLHSLVLVRGRLDAAGCCSADPRGAVGTERLTAAALLALGVGLWAYLAARRRAAHRSAQIQASRTPSPAARRSRAVYLPAVLAGLGGALLGRPRRTASPARSLLLAGRVAVTGWSA